MELQQINAELEADVMVRAIHDVKGIDMGDNMVRYKAELDFDGRQLVRAYLDQINMNQVHEVWMGARAPMLAQRLFALVDEIIQH